ncbi:glycosyl hydrolase family 8 [Devosia sp. Naph2]|uniref:glycosyl hydrolase family 8 n=1 Tax=Devosia polycyclovorans TaxID=3345148 RepID=UPI0035D0E6F7
MKRRWLLALAVISAFQTHALAQTTGSITAQEWAAYGAAFINEGRIIDGANGGISHSEGQGYGMLLAYLANDAESFDQIWQFTRQELMVRDDGLVAWKWDPSVTPRITDQNNASDGDILIAYALIRAGEAWGRTDLIDSARTLADALGRAATMRWRGSDVLLPGSFGFGRDDQDDGPLINLSYWVFEAFPYLARIAPETDWQGIAQTGRRLVNESRFGPAGLPTDWISLRGNEPAPAQSFEPEFGYNSVRIPLYLMRAGTTQAALLRQFALPLSEETAGTIRVSSGRIMEELSEPGYRIIGAAISCVLDNQPISADLISFEPQSYYGSTLHLLTLSFLRQSAPHCL